MFITGSAIRSPSWDDIQLFIQASAFLHGAAEQNIQGFFFCVGLCGLFFPEFVQIVCVFLVVSPPGGERPVLTQPIWGWRASPLRGLWEETQAHSRSSS